MASRDRARAQAARSTRSSRIRPSAATASDRCPSPSSSLARAPRVCAASQRPCATGTIRSWSPCQTVTGTRMMPTLKPHGWTNARSSSCQPQIPLVSAARVLSAMCSANSPVRDATSTSDTRSPNAVATSSAVTLPKTRAACSRNGWSSEGPPSAAPNSSMLSWPMPSRKSSPSASNGATPASVAAAATRPGRSAAAASAWGPPPDHPIVRHRSTARASSTASMSGAASATVRPGLRSDRP